MIELTASRREAAKYLFPDDYPNLAFVHGVIERLLPGQVYVDRRDRPTRCLVKTNAPYAYAAGLQHDEEIRDALRLLDDRADFKVVIPSLPSSRAGVFGLAGVPRRLYRHDAVCPAAAPAELRRYGRLEILRLADEAMFRRCLWFELIGSLLGGTEPQLEHFAALALWDSSRGIIASEAYVVCSRRYAEIGTITHPDYRGRGLSTVLCGQAMRWAAGRGRVSIWSCDEANTASWRVAEKLGMQAGPPYRFFKRM